MIIICRDCKNNFEAPNRRTKKCQPCVKTSLNLRSKRYKANNKEKVGQYNKNYKKKYRDEIKEYNRTYNIQNRTTIQSRQTRTHKERRKTDMNYKMSILLRSRLQKFCRGNYSSIQNLVGCSIQNFRYWIEYNFNHKMNWNNHGTIWHIDHVLPCSKFDLTNDDEMKICSNWKNLRPLLTEKNLAKNNKLYLKDILNQIIVSNYFYKVNNQDYNNINYDHFATKLLEKFSSGTS